MKEAEMECGKGVGGASKGGQEEMGEKGVVVVCRNVNEPSYLGVARSKLDSSSQLIELESSSSWLVKQPSQVRTSIRLARCLVDTYIYFYFLIIYIILFGKYM